MNSRFIHDQTFTGCSITIMGCTQDEIFRELATESLISRMGILLSVRAGLGVVNSSQSRAEDVEE
jgi:hypothetical protein